jgi:hypothetical protein
VPSTPKQMRSAGRELRRRIDGEVKQQDRGKGSRPFGAASTETLRSFAGWPKPNEQRAAAINEKFLRVSGNDVGAKPTRAFGKASNADINFFANASDDEIRKRNGQT